MLDLDGLANAPSMQLMFFNSYALRRRAVFQWNAAPICLQFLRQGHSRNLRLWPIIFADALHQSVLVPTNGFVAQVRAGVPILVPVQILSAHFWARSQPSHDPPFR